MALLRNILGISLGVAMSQFPEYSQQYVQRLGGAAQELAAVVSDFDATAKSAGKTRDQALQELSGTEFLDGRQGDMRSTISRSAYLNETYAMLKDANAYERLSHINRLTDSTIAQSAWEDFEPAIPLTPESLILLLLGYAGGYGSLTGAKKVSSAVFSRRRNRHRNWTR